MNSLEFIAFEKNSSESREAILVNGKAPFHIPIHSRTEFKLGGHVHFALRRNMLKRSIVYLQRFNWTQVDRRTTFMKQFLSNLRQDRDVFQSRSVKNMND